MTLNQEVEIIYLYIVDGLSMEKVGIATGWKTSEVSDAVRGYGFNDDCGQRAAYQSGKDRGRYKKGKPSCRGITVTRQIIRSFLQNASEWEYDFEWYISELAKDAAAQKQSEQKKQEQLIAQQNRERQIRLQAEEAARREKERRERELREQQRQQLEQQKRQKEQQQKNTAEYYRLLNDGKEALKAQRLQQALDTFRAAQRLFATAELNVLIAQVLAISGNAAQHCKSIIAELRSYESFLRSENRMLSIEQLLWYARALVADRQNTEAAYRYSMAADIAYNNNDFINADAIYKESYKNTGIYTSFCESNFFKLAYARSRVPGIGADDHRFCIEAYCEAVRKKQWTETAVGNQGWHYIMLGEYEKAVEQLRLAISFGNNQPYIYRNLFDAFTKLHNYNEAYKVTEDMGRLKISYQPWEKAECIYLGRIFGDQSNKKAAELYINQLESHGPHPHSCYRLLYAHPDHKEAVRYGLLYLEQQKRSVSINSECAAFLLSRAEKSGNSDLIEKAFKYNLAEKARREREAKEKAEREAKQKQLERERQEKEEKLAQEKRRKEEELRLAQEKKHREQLKRKQDEQMLLLML